jgi:Zn-dependent membrane protease YugP
MDFLFILVIIIPIIAQIKINSSYNKYLKIDNSKGLTGSKVARMILDKNGLNNVTINEIGGTLSDHYSPKNKNINLSARIYDGKSISSIAVAAHECGHAIQDKEGYSFLRFRSNLVPIVNITSKISTIFIILSFVLEYAQLLEVGIWLLSVGLLFQFITLPVEFDASNRAKVQLQELGLISKTEITGVRKVLGAAALTYVAGFIAQALQILRYAFLLRRRN